MSKKLMTDPGARTARAKEKRRLMLRFLRDEVWTIGQVAADVLGISYHAAYVTLQAMERDGLISSSPMAVNYSGRVRKVVLYGITSQGLAFAFDLNEEQTQRNPWEPGKTNPLFVPHQIEIQSARLRAERAGWTDWKPARALMGLGMAKIPDAVATGPDGVRVAVEVELNIKTPKRYEAIAGAYISQIKAGRWEKIDYLCPDADFAKRLARVFASLPVIRLEKRGGSGLAGQMQQQHLDRMRFFAKDAWPGGEAYQAKLKSVEGDAK